MTQQRSNWMRPAPAVAIATLLIQPLQADVIEKMAKVGGTTVHYKTVLPNGYDAAKAYPAILAFGGGPQDMNTVNGVLTRNLRAEAEKRGYIVIAPAAPDDELFFEEGARIFPEFLKMILADYKIQDGKFHIAGPSNGGIASFHVAAANPPPRVSPVWAHRLRKPSLRPARSHRRCWPRAKSRFPPCSA